MTLAIGIVAAPSSLTFIRYYTSIQCIAKDSEVLRKETKIQELYISGQIKSNVTSLKSIRMIVIAMKQMPSDETFCIKNKLVSGTVSHFSNLSIISYNLLQQINLETGRIFFNYRELAVFTMIVSRQKYSRPIYFNHFYLVLCCRLRHEWKQCK